MNDSYVTKDQRQSQVLMEGSIPSTPALYPPNKGKSQYASNF
jgi:hypothetical protein